MVTYRLAFTSAVATYGIVVFKAYRARVKPGAKVTSTAVTLLSDENVQYLRECGPYERVEQLS
jgi:transmembrane protein 33